MFEITVKSEFCAAHALTIRGDREPLHGHNWTTTVTIAGETLDADGLLCDFHAVERSLAEILGELNNRNLSEHPAFLTTNPTAEHVARHIALKLAARLGSSLGTRAYVARVSVTEAPGCCATFFTPGPSRSA